MAVSLLLFSACSLLCNKVSAQQFPGSPFPLSYPGLDAACLSALNQTITCPPFLASTAITGPLSSSQLTSLCNATCYASMRDVRAGIEGNCTSSSDVIVDSGVAFPATYVVDNFLLAWNTSCRKDQSTGTYCDTLLASWANESSLTPTQSCSDCMLGIQQIELDSPVGYSDGFAQYYENLTSSCQASGYAFTSPTSYALNSTATSTGATSTSTASTSVCAKSYTVKSGDTCDSIAMAQSISTFSLLYYNNLNIYCTDFPAAGSSICLPQSCDIYTVRVNDTCISISGAQGNITATQIQAWNPNINAMCGNLGRINDTQICISPPGGWLDPSAQMNLSVSTAVSAAPLPTNAESGTNTNCGRWYTIQEGDNCALVSTYESIALDDFYFLNPEINSTCGNLILGQAYCVQAVGSISTYANYTVGGQTAGPCNGANAASSCFGQTTGYPTTSLLTGNTTFSPTGTATSTANATIAAATQSPTALGTIPNCHAYRNYQASTITSSNSSMTVNSCSYLAILYTVNTSALIDWNPSLTQENCSLQPGYSYCVQRTAPSGNPSTVPIGGFCEAINGTEQGTTTSCTCYTNVYGYDSGSYGCSEIASDYNITLSELQSWNPWTGSNCTEGLYADLGNSSQRAVCIAASSSSTQSTPTPASSTSTMAPTQSGIAANCNAYYTVPSGGSCSSIESIYSITFAQFYSWNPSVGSNCQYLDVGYAYCISVAGGSPTTSVTPTKTSSQKANTPPAPTQSGVASDCDRWYTVTNGDSCSAVESDYNITFSQLYQWNPAIGSNCQYLVVGDAVCVGVSS